MRLRIVAFLVIGIATALMWSDNAIEWWSDIVAFALRVNEDATTSVMSSRPSGDADLHAVLWGASASLLAVSYVVFRHRMTALVALACWSIGVEIAQPWFTAMRSRQATDLFGNVAGIGLVSFVVVVQQIRKSRRTS